MSRNPHSRRIEGEALEMIMQDVLQGMLDFTRQTCAGSSTTDLEIQSVEAAESPSSQASILPFARPRSSSTRDQ